jgi:photosystem II stability/assembly factor-like uncharacterized protein
MKAKFYTLFLLAALSFGFVAESSAALIYTHPVNVTECAGLATVSYSITLSRGVIVDSYQWQYGVYNKLLKMWVWNNVNYAFASGVDSRTLTLEFNKFYPLTTSYNGIQFQCIVKSEKITETSQGAFLYVNSTPSIYSQPSGATKNVGESVTFSVGASGATSYQWKKNGIDIEGATSSILTFSNLIADDAGGYSCRITNDCGYKTSSTATLTVNAPDYPDGWFKQTTSRTEAINQLFAISKFEAWSTLGTEQLLYTSDGGEIWEIKSTVSGKYWRGIEFINSSVGFIGGRMEIGKTTDGGASWTYTNFYTLFDEITEAFYINDLEFVSSTVGYAVGEHGFIAKTSNGGTSWELQNYDGVPPSAINATLKSVSFADANNGYAVGYFGTVIKTTDGGENWNIVDMGVSDNFTDVYAINATTAFVVNGYDNLFKLTAGGSSISNYSSKVYPQVLRDLNSITFTDAQNGYIGGKRYFNGEYYAAVARTKDGGETWYTQVADGVQTSTEFFDIEMYDTDNGWVGGSVGNIWRTAYGGCLNPSVNLGPDQAFCASGSVTLNAGAGNTNCFYLWNTGSEASQISASSTDTYWARVTNLCGVVVSDTVKLNVFPLPEANAGDDVSMCFGDTIQLNASGGSSYSWTTGTSYLSETDVQNPLATPPNNQTTNFTVIVTDDNLCSKTDVVAVTVYPVPTTSITAPAFVCGQNNASLYHTGTSGISEYNWSFDDEANVTGGTTINPTVNWNTLGTKHLSLVVSKNNCYSDTAFKDIEVRVIPTADFTVDASVCKGATGTLTYTGSAPSEASYNWGTDGGSLSGSGQGPLDISWGTGGEKTVSLVVTQAECPSSTVQHDVNSVYPYEGEKICIVTIDQETGKNMVVWDKTPDVNIASYNIYRLGTGGVYTILGDVSVDDLSIFVDATSDPESKQYLYKIAAVDNCGNESAKSHYHKTLFLQYSSSVGGVNLFWQDYEVENETLDFSDFDIYRGSDSTALTKITTVSGSLVFKDTDPIALTQKYYYRVAGVLPEACDPEHKLGKKASSGPYVHSLSNLEDNRLNSSGVSDYLTKMYNVQVYPNPFKEETRISYRLPSSAVVKLEVFNIVGERIAQIFENNQSAGDYQQKISAADVNYQNGLYYIRISIDGNQLTRKVMLTK